MEPQPGRHNMTDEVRQGRALTDEIASSGVSLTPAKQAHALQVGDFWERLDEIQGVKQGTNMASVLLAGELDDEDSFGDPED